MNLQLFKKDRMKDLYEHVDEILAKNKVNKFFLLKGIKNEGILLSLSKMKKRTTFYKSDLNDIYALANIHVSSERDAFYSMMSCNEWGDMSQEMQDSLMAMIFDDLRPVLNET